jgi:peroxiredoxin
MKRLLLLTAVLTFAIGTLLFAQSDKVNDFTLNDLDGNPVTLSELDGLIILDFWATWCPPCKVEIPYLQNLYNDYSDQGLHIIGISTEDINTQQRFIDQMRQDDVDMSYTLLIDPNGAVTRQYGIEGIPTTIFVKPDLSEIEREVGFIPQYAERFREIIENNLP